MFENLYEEPSSYNLMIKDVENGKMLYSTTYCKNVIDNVYDNILICDDNMAVICKNGKFGALYVFPEGDVMPIVPVEFDAFERIGLMTMFISKNKNMLLNTALGESKTLEIKSYKVIDNGRFLQTFDGEFYHVFDTYKWKNVLTEPKIYPKSNYEIHPSYILASDIMEKYIFFDLNSEEYVVSGKGRIFEYI